MNLLEIKNKLTDRKEFNTKDTRTRNRILNKIEEVKSNENIHEEQDSTLIQDELVLKDYINSCIMNGIYVLDLETTGLDCFTDTIVGVCIYTPNEKPAYIPILHTDIDNNVLEGQLEAHIVKEQLIRLANSMAYMVNQNLKFDLKFLKQQWDISVPARNILWDTQIGAFLLNENEPTHSLKPLYDKYILGKKDTGSKFKDLFGNIPFNYIPLEIAKIYGANDGYKTFKLYEFQKNYLDLEHKREDIRKLANVFFNIEMRLIPLLVDMELTGIGLDLVRAKELEYKYEGKLIECQQKLNIIIEKYKSKIDNHEKIAPLITKNGFNLNSPTQLQYLLYDIFKLKKVNKTSTDKATLELLLLENLKLDHKEFIETLLEYKQLEKLLTSFIQKLPREIKDDGKIHGQFNQCGTQTGRYSSSNPKLIGA